MKKILISIFIIFIIALLIYIFGLIHLFIPSGTWAVIETKTGGIEDEVIEGGKWSKVLCSLY